MKRICKTTLCLVLCLALLLAFALTGCTTDESAALRLGTVVAQGSCGEQLTWQLDEKGLLLISGQGNMQSTAGEGRGPGYYEWDEYRNKIHTVCLSDGVTNIHGFGSCPALTSVVIPDSVEMIDGWAFFRCTALNSVSLGKGLKSIGGFAFYECSALSSLTLPDTVTNIDEYAFYNCAALKSVEFPNSVTSIGHWAFSNCTALERVELSAGVSSIEKNAFSGCPVLSAIHVAEGNPTYMDQDGVLFDKVEKTLLLSPAASSNSSCTIPDGMTGIEAYAFLNSTALTEVEIPASVTSIGKHAFSNCPALSAIHVDADNPAFAAQDGVLFDKDQKTLIHYPAGKQDASYEIPDGVTSIEEGAFFCNAWLCDITIPASVLEIGKGAFDYCPSLSAIHVADGNSKYVEKDGVLFKPSYHYILVQYPSGKPDASYTIPYGVTSIGDGAFFRCKALTELKIPAGVTSISDSAFVGCDSLVLCVTRDSYAESYAKKHNLPYEHK